MKIINGLVKLGKIVAQHSPEILTAIGIVGFISSTVTAVHNTPKAVEMLKQAEEEKGEPLKAKEVVKVTWKYYIFPVIITVLSIACILGARKIESGRTAALLTACKVTEEASERFEDATREVVGDKKYNEIKQKVAENQIKENPMFEGNVINTGTGNTLYYEPLSNQYIRCSRDYIDRGINTVNKELRERDTMDVNDYLDCFQLPSIDATTTGALEWDINNGGYLDLEFHYFEIETGEVCGAFRPDRDPKSPRRWSQY